MCHSCDFQRATLSLTDSFPNISCVTRLQILQYLHHAVQSPPESIFGLRFVVLGLPECLRGHLRTPTVGQDGQQHLDGITNPWSLFGHCLLFPPPNTHSGFLCRKSSIHDYGGTVSWPAPHAGTINHCHMNNLPRFSIT